VPDGSLQREHDLLGRVFGAIVIITLGIVATVATLSGPSEERWGMLDGASAWPSEILRGIGVLLGIVLIGRATSVYRSIRHRAAVTEAAPTAEIRGSTTPADNNDNDNKRVLADERSSSSLLNWNASGSLAGRINISTLLAELSERCRWRAVVYRISLRSTGLIAVFTGMLIAAPPSPPPIRGDLPFTIHVVLMGLLAFVLNLLALIAFDAAQVCSRFTKLLTQRPSEWSSGAVQSCRKYADYPGILTQELLDIESIAESTDRVMRLVLYPVALAAISFLAWHPAIDAWEIGPSAVALYGSSVVLAGAAAWQLRRQASRARHAALRRIDEIAPDHREYAESARKLVIDEDRGAFTGWQRDPTFQTVVVPIVVIVLAKSLELLGVIG
jgi:hypothetical protein